MAKNKLFSIVSNPIASLGLVATLVGAVQAPAMSVTIDTFKSVQDANGLQTVTRSATGTSSDVDTGLPTTEVIGGARQISVQILSGTRGATLEVDANVGQVFFDTQTGTTARAKIRWDANNNTIGLNGANIKANGEGAFVLNVTNLDLATNLAFSVTDMNNQVGNITLNSISGTGYKYFMFDEISNSSVDLTNVKFIELSTSGEPPSLDFGFDFLESRRVPFAFSPALGFILSGGLVGLNQLKKKMANA